jgi:hypothetical protein
MALIREACLQSDRRQRQISLIEFGAGMFDSKFSNEFTNRGAKLLAKCRGQVNGMNTHFSCDLSELQRFGKAFDKQFSSLLEPCRRGSDSVGRLTRGFSQKFECETFNR